MGRRSVYAVLGVGCALLLARDLLSRDTWSRSSHGLQHGSRRESHGWRVFVTSPSRRPGAVDAWRGGNVSFEKGRPLAFIHIAKAAGGSIIHWGRTNGSPEVRTPPARAPRRRI